LREGKKKKDSPPHLCFSKKKKVGKKLGAQAGGKARTYFEIDRGKKKKRPGLRDLRRGQEQGGWVFSDVGANPPILEKKGGKLVKGGEKCSETRSGKGKKRSISD